jgi:hypothetical protein
MPSRRPSNITAIGILTLIQGLALIATGLYMALANSFLSSNMFFIPDAIEPNTFRLLQKVWGSVGVILGAASVLIGFWTLGGKKRAWVSNVAVSSVVVAAFLTIHDIKFLPIEVLLLSLFMAGIILANLFRTSVRSFFDRSMSTTTPKT